MLDFVDVKFESNKFYLMAELLTNLGSIEKTLGKSILKDKKQIPLLDRRKVRREFKQFCDIANKIPEIKDLIEVDERFDSLNGNRQEQIEYNRQINEKIESFANIATLEDLSNSENQKYGKAFERLFDMPFFKYADMRATEHARDIGEKFDLASESINAKMKQIIGKPVTKQVNFITLPPELFSQIPHYLPNSEKDGNYKGVVSVSPFMKVKKNMANVILLHEITHTEIPLPDKCSFSNDIQYDVYGRINHSLVELANDCEMGMQLCGFDSYFKSPMHNELVLNGQGEPIDINDLEKYDIKSNNDLNFECRTKDIMNRTVVTKSNELGNAKIRGLVYPYFLMYKNRLSNNPIEDTLKEIERDSKKIEKIYGKEFLSTIGENEKLAEIFNNVRDVESLQELNDIIAEKEFNIERQKEYSREDTSESENKFIGRISNNGEFRDNSYLNIKGLNSYLEKQNEDNNRSQERESSEEIER